MTRLAYSALSSALLALSLVLSVGCGEVLVAPDAGSGGIDAATADAGVDLPDATPPDPCTGDVKAEDLADCLIIRACSTMNRCYNAFPTLAACVDAGGPFGRGIGQADMQAHGTVSNGGDTFLIELRRIVDYIGDGTITYDGVKAGECLTHVEDVACPDLYFDQNPMKHPSCEATFTGTVDQDGVCFDSQQCQGTNATCFNPEIPCGLQCCGAGCDLANKLNEICDTNWRCEEGTYCVAEEGTTGTSPVCRTGEAGAPCWHYGECDEGFWCEFPVGGGRGTCKADFPADANCTEDAQCPRPQRCVGDNLMVMNPLGTCAPVHTEGAPCDGWCDGPLYCDQPDTSVTGTCKLFPDVNENCRTTNRCRGQLWCDTTDFLCKAPRTQGTTCTASFQCAAPLFCTADVGVTPGSCRPPQANDNLCGDGYHCASGVCQDNITAPGTYVCSDYIYCQ